VRLFDLGIRGDHTGPHTEGELRELLEQYRRDNPGDDTFARVVVVEIPEHGTAGTVRSVFDFIPRTPPKRPEELWLTDLERSGEPRCLTGVRGTQNAVVLPLRCGSRLPTSSITVSAVLAQWLVDVADDFARLGVLDVFDVAILPPVDRAPDAVPAVARKMFSTFLISRNGRFSPRALAFSRARPARARLVTPPWA
jgi:hypothetical protein